MHDGKNYDAKDRKLMTELIHLELSSGSLFYFFLLFPRMEINLFFASNNLVQVVKEQIILSGR